MSSEKAATVLQFFPNLMLGEFVCAIGVFDGLHEGHRYIIDETVSQAKRLQLPAIAITFDKDPDELFLPSLAQRKLLTNEDRIDLLAKSGVDMVLVIPFDLDLSLREPRDFLETVIAAHGAMRGIHVGSDFHFGHNASGTVENVRLWAADRNCEVFSHELLTDEGSSVTSTRIRNALEAGELALANKLLSRPHYLWATVTKGRSVGKELGFPTANLELKERLVCPADGVYACAVAIDGRVHKAATSVGVPATFADTSSTIETHILDFDGDLYGHTLQIFFLEYLRKMISFNSVDELKRAVFQNIEQARACVIPKDLLWYLKNQ